MLGATVTISSGYSGSQSSYAPCSKCVKTSDSTTETDQQRETAKTPSSPAELTPEEQKQVADLKQQDREVKSHEAAHIAAGGAYVRGGATFSYQSGPDGKRYAVGGEVSIDTSPEDEPSATIRKMQTVRSAALAPANPSGQDRSVAAAAASQEAQARQQLNSDDSSETGGPEKTPQKTAKNRVYTPGGKNETPVVPSEIDVTA